MSQYYIVSDEMKKAKDSSVPSELQELADDLKKLKKKYNNNPLAVACLQQFSKLLEEAKSSKKQQGIMRHLNHLMSSMLNNLKPRDKKITPESLSPNAVAGVRG